MRLSENLAFGGIGRVCVCQSPLRETLVIIYTNSSTFSGA